MEISTHEVVILLVSILSGGVAVAIVSQGAKKLFRLKTDSVIHTMVVAVSYLAGAAQYIVTFKTKLPPEILGVSGSAIFGVSQAVFKYSKYASGFLSKVSAYNASQKLHLPSPAQAMDLAPGEQTTNKPAQFEL